MSANLGPQVIPSLLVKDIEATLNFYERLGFRPTGAWPEEAPTWCEVTRDGFSLQFYTDPPQGTPDTPVLSGTLYVATSDVQALADEFSGVATFAWGPEVMEYGWLEFAVQDPNGYYIAFKEPVT